MGISFTWVRVPSRVVPSRTFVHRRSRGFLHGGSFTGGSFTDVRTHTFTSVPARRFDAGSNYVPELGRRFLLGSFRLSRLS